MSEAEGEANKPQCNRSYSMSTAGECSYPELARDFEAIYERFCDQLRQDRANSERFDQLMFEATGLTGDEWPVPLGQDPEFERVWHKIAKECLDSPTDEHGCRIDWNEIHGIIYPLCEKIMSLPAHTLADLALQARAVAL